MTSALQLPPRLTGNAPVSVRVANSDGEGPPSPLSRPSRLSTVGPCSPPNVGYLRRSSAEWSSKERLCQVLCHSTRPGPAAADMRICIGQMGDEAMESL
jgi:hypothetical protein